MIAAVYTTETLSRVREEMRAAIAHQARRGSGGALALPDLPKGAVHCRFSPSPTVRRMLRLLVVATYEPTLTPAASSSFSAWARSFSACARWFDVWARPRGRRRHAAFEAVRFAEALEMACGEKSAASSVYAEKHVLSLLSALVKDYQRESAYSGTWDYRGDPYRMQRDAFGMPIDPLPSVCPTRRTWESDVGRALGFSRQESRRLRETLRLLIAVLLGVFVRVSERVSVVPVMSREHARTPLRGSETLNAPPVGIPYEDGVMAGRANQRFYLAA